MSGYCTKLGPRNTNEDRLISLPDLSVDVDMSSIDVSAAGGGGGASRGGGKALHGHGYFAVYDGHSGDQAATHLQKELHGAICRHPKYFTDLVAAIQETCVQMDKDFLDICRKTNVSCGTTALGVFIRSNTLFAFNIGDCQAILSQDGAVRELSKAHKAGRPDELERIQRANGWITEEKELYLARLHIMDLSDPLVRDKASGVQFVLINRVCGELAVSRSIGDPAYKGFTPGAEVDDDFFFWPDDHNRIFYADPVIPNPECMVVELGPSDEFLVIASDGLWDVMSAVEAVSIIRSSLRSGQSTSEVSEKLCELALRLGSSDNVTIVIVQFVHS